MTPVRLPVATMLFLICLRIVAAAEADLLTVKSLWSSDPEPSEGQIVSYAIEVSNLGPDVATSVSVRDSLPKALAATQRNGEATKGDYQYGIWSVGDLAVGETASLLLEGVVNGCQVGETISNNAEPAISDFPDPSPAGDDLSVVVTVSAPDETPLTSWNEGTGGVTASGARIDYSGAPTGWNSNSITSRPLSDLNVAASYSVRWRVVGNPAQTTWVIGLGKNESGSNWRDVDYGIRSSAGQFTVYENGVWRTSGPSMGAGDVLSISVAPGTIEYLLNGEILYSTSYPGSPDFYIDSSFQQGTIALETALVNGAGQPGGGGTGSEVPVTGWVGATGGVTSTGNEISYSGAPTGWAGNTINSTAFSSLGVSADYRVAWTVGSDPASTTWIVGLGAEETRANWRDVEHGLRSSNGLLNVYENGVLLASGGRIETGDLLSIRVRDTEIHYELNGAVVHTAIEAAPGDYYLDTSFKNGDISLTDFVWRDLTAGGSVPPPGAECLPPDNNTAPVADAGSNLDTTVGSSVTLAGSGIDVDGDDLTFSWSIASRPGGSMAGIADPGAQSFSFVPDVEGDYVFVLEVDDGFATSAPNSVVVAASQALPAGNALLTMHVPLDEGAGTSIADIIQNLDNTPPLAPHWVVGKVGDAAVRTTGIGSGIPLSAPFQYPLNQFSVALWVKPLAFDPDDDRETDVLLANDPDPGAAQLRLDLDNRHANAFRFLVTLDGNQYALRSITIPVPNAWYHVAASFDGSLIKLFVDGQEEASVAATGAVAGSSNSLVLAGSESGFSVDAEIDDIRAYADGLSLAEVRDLVALATPVPSGVSGYLGALQSCAGIDLGNPVFHSGEQGFSDQTRLTMNPVEQPIGDGISLFVPAEQFPAQPLLPCGMLDVTRPPFAADPSGQTDSTAAIQSAVNAAVEYTLAVFFPPGHYQVSDTIQCLQPAYTRTNGKTLNDVGPTCAFVGSTSGSERPRIVLEDGADGFDDPSAPKPVVRIFALNETDPSVPDYNSSFENSFNGIDIDVGRLNPGAAGLAFRGAQGSHVQDVTIWVRSGYSGLLGANGSGGMTANVAVVGGQIGIEAADFGTQPMATFVGLNLVQQSSAAITYSGPNEGMTLVGSRIVAPYGNSGPLVLARGSTATKGQVSIVDSTFEFVDAAAENTVVDTNRGVALHNSYVRNADVTVRFDGGEVLPGNSQDWRHIPDFAHGQADLVARSVTVAAPVYINNIRQSELRFVTAGIDSPPPAMLSSQHVWREADFPSPESHGAVNVKSAPYFATGDGTTDDYAAIQLALEENEIVFLPKGYYRISRTLELRADNKLMSVSGALAFLIAHNNPAGDFYRDIEAAQIDVDNGIEPIEDSPRPLIRTADTAVAETVLSHLGLFTDTNSFSSHPLHWRSGGDSKIRNIVSRQRRQTTFSSRSLNITINHPMFLLSDSSGGRIYGLSATAPVGTENTPLFRQLLLQGTVAPLYFYMLDPEHNISEASIEIRDSANVFVYGTKFEGAYPMYWLADSRNVNIFGTGGNGGSISSNASYPPNWAQYTPSLIRIERSTDVRITTAMDRLKGRAFLGVTSDPPDTWHSIISIDASGTEYRTEILDRPALFLLGTPTTSLLP